MRLYMKPHLQTLHFSQTYIKVTKIAYVLSRETSLSKPKPNSWSDQILLPKHNGIRILKYMYKHIWTFKWHLQIFLWSNHNGNQKIELNNNYITMNQNFLDIVSLEFQVFKRYIYGLITVLKIWTQKCEENKPKESRRM